MRLRVLFVCSCNRLRSPTAEQVFASYPDIEVASAGVNPDAEERVSAELIDWADLIFAMEARHWQKLSRQFRAQLKHKQIVCLDIPNEYDYMDPELVRLS